MSGQDHAVATLSPWKKPITYSVGCWVGPSQSEHVGRCESLLPWPCLKSGLSSQRPTHCIFYATLAPTKNNKLFLLFWNIFMTFGADSYTRITLKASGKFCLSKLAHELKVTFLMIVILHIFCCHMIQDTPFTADNWCLCLHSTEVQYVCKTLVGTSSRLWWNDCINMIKFHLFRESIFLNIEKTLWSSAKWRWILENQNELRAEWPNKKRSYSEICKQQKNGLAGSCDADGRKKNT